MAVTAKARVRRIERTGSFRATGEDGGRYTLHVFSCLLEAGPLDGPQAGSRAIRSIWTEDGEAVDRVGRGEYRTAWGEILRSDDPGAP
jgi:hypothetical protein